MSNDYIVQWLEEVAPNRTPTTQLSEWEYGVLAGYRLLIEQLKIKLKINEEAEEEIK